jgi:hypothetical protein
MLLLDDDRLPGQPLRFGTLKMTPEIFKKDFGWQEIF